MKTNVFVRRRGYDWFVEWDVEGKDGKPVRHRKPLGECSSERDAVQMGSLATGVDEDQITVKEAL